MTPKLIIDKFESISNFIKESTSSGGFEATLKYGEYKVSAAQPIPKHIVKPPYASLSDGFKLQEYYSRDVVFAEIKSPKQIKQMKRAGRLAADCLKLCMESTCAGITTEEIDRIGHEFIVKSGAYPAGVNFHGFPKAICISVNEVACHGIPDNRPLQDGDIVSYDCTLYIDGVFGDCAGTVCVGNVDSQVKKLVDVSRECLDKAIGIIKPAVKFSKLADVVTEHANANNFGVVKEFGGHFIGEMMHMPPMISFSSRYKCNSWAYGSWANIYNWYVCCSDDSFIEPIISQGNPAVYTWPDGWTIVTRDNGRCSQFEHTVLVTLDGCEILTLPSS
ncbi:bifunctional Peptidase M24 [Babesia duncani]|uniref:Methionine aminopeptidase n=1 Tax=Babesia duncani TaxID=323732 RepID=A0AAD9PKJ3_9APIC|nr:bifunctional Peptidase M24 [Babesia duncani]